MGIISKPIIMKPGTIIKVNRPRYELVSSYINPTTARKKIIKKLIAAIMLPTNETILK
jgi:hypothetical protein